jgi:hypothetical protein
MASTESESSAANKSAHRILIRVSNAPFYPYPRTLTNRSSPYNQSEYIGGRKGEWGLTLLFTVLGIFRSNNQPNASMGFPPWPWPLWSAFADASFSLASRSVGKVSFVQAIEKLLPIEKVLIS